MASPSNKCYRCDGFMYSDTCTHCNPPQSIVDPRDRKKPKEVKPGFKDTTLAPLADPEYRRSSSVGSEGHFRRPLSWSSPERSERSNHKRPKTSAAGPIIPGTNIPYPQYCSPSTESNTSDQSADPNNRILHTPGRNIHTSASLIPERNDELVQCNKCSARVKHLRMHQMNKHIELFERCHCGDLLYIEKMAAHIEVRHTQADPNLICTYEGCKKGAFQSRKLLDKHMQTHTLVNKGKCEKCSHEYTRKDNLSKHKCKSIRNDNNL